MIAVDKIHRWYGRTHAVRGVSLGVSRGEVLGLLGPNGAGKSSTIRMIAGVLEPHAGRVSIAGHDTMTAPIAARRSLGYLPESAPVYNEMSARSFVLHRAAMAGVPRRERRNRVDAALERCRVRNVSKQRTGTLSKGYRQRVALAGAIVHGPPVLVLDEPTNGLDPTQLREARSLIAELAEDRTVLICSHVLGEVERICGRVVIIGGGRVLADEPVRHQPGAGCAVAEAFGVDGEGGPLVVPGLKVSTEPLGSGWTRFTGSKVTDDGAPLPGQSAVERLGAAITSRGGRLRLLTDRPDAVGGSLESLFVSVLESAETGAEDAEGQVGEQQAGEDSR
ncbi:MAG: ABC transporter ATP-binding protein [Planctomycetota bacterium]